MDFQTLHSLNFLHFLEQDDFTFCKLYQIHIKIFIKRKFVFQVGKFDFQNGVKHITIGFNALNG